MVASRRKRLGMTQAETASLAGMSRAALANIEVGRQNLAVHQLYQLAAALQLDSAGKLLPVRARERGLNDAELTIPSTGLSELQRAQVEQVVRAVKPARRTDGGS